MERHTEINAYIHTVHSGSVGLGSSPYGDSNLELSLLCSFSLFVFVLWEKRLASVVVEFLWSGEVIISKELQGLPHGD